MKSQNFKPKSIDKIYIDGQKARTNVKGDEKSYIFLSYNCFLLYEFEVSYNYDSVKQYQMLRMREINSRLPH